MRGKGRLPAGGGAAVAGGRERWAKGDYASQSREKGRKRNAFFQLTKAKLISWFILLLKKPFFFVLYF
jgi:hypothetical protein